MPQVDLESLVTACAGGGNDRKIACETLADDDPLEDNVIDAEDDAPEVPPESFWLSKDAEYDWFDRNAFNYERKESTKGNSNSTNLNQHTNPSSNSNSQRFSVNLKSKASIIGLPKTQKTTLLDAKRRSTTCKPPNIRLFPKRSESVGKSITPMAEPSSPKVSCMGRVRSKRGRRRSNSLRRREDPLDKSSTVGEKKKAGFYSKVMSMFRSKKAQRKPSRSGSRKVMEVLMEEPVVVEPQRKSVSVKVREIPGSSAEPPGLGGMQRFASGRRSGSWTSDDFNQAISGELDRRVGRS